MTELANQEDGNRSLRIYELAAELHQSDPFDHFVRYRMDDNSYRGVVRGGDKIVLVRRVRDLTDVYLGDLTDGSLRHYQGRGKVLSLLEDIEEFNVIIDLDTNGRRWEGGMRDGNPFGYGILYNEEGLKEYEGFLYNGTKVCWGIDYYDDIEKEKFKGFYLFNTRYGRGVSQDRNEDVEFDGDYISKNPVCRKGKMIVSSSDTRLVIKGSNGMRMLCLEYWQQCLESIVIHEASMTQLHVFSLKNLPKLKTVNIGSNCCCPSKKDTNEDTWFIINSCPSLETIVIGSNSFKNYSSLKLKNLPSLKTLTIEMSCFCKLDYQLRTRWIRGIPIEINTNAYTKRQISCRSIVLMSTTNVLVLPKRSSKVENYLDLGWIIQLF